ncbi:MAG TPA: hypothetical protein DEF43_01225, partial [Chloroflexus aurantiacus]|nr:hypothetical protein [Chloroflexus aurantiacus]
SWSRGCWMCSCRSSSRSGIHATPARRRIVAPGSCLRTSGCGQHLPAMAGMLARRLEACATESRHGEHVQTCLTQRDMWVMHREAGEGVSHNIAGRTS